MGINTIFFTFFTTVLCTNCVIVSCRPPILGERRKDCVWEICLRNEDVGAEDKELFALKNCQKGCAGMRWSGRWFQSKKGGAGDPTGEDIGITCEGGVVCDCVRPCIDKRRRDAFVDFSIYDSASASAMNSAANTIV